MAIWIVLGLVVVFAIFSMISGSKPKKPGESKNDGYRKI